MEKSNLELFKQALNEAWDNKIRREVEACTEEEIVTSERHKAAMQTILDGTYDKSAKWKLTRAKVVAILVAAALLLASCAIIYRNEIRDLVEEIFEDFSKSTYSDEEDANGKTIEDVYELSYVPEGYVLEESEITPIYVKYTFINSNNILVFEQKVLDYSSFLFDVENGYNLLLNNNELDIYYKATPKYNFYLWNNGNYSFLIISSNEISNEEIQIVITNLTIK